MGSRCSVRVQIERPMRAFDTPGTLARIDVASATEFATDCHPNSLAIEYAKTQRLQCRARPTYHGVVVDAVVKSFHRNDE
jgi:hypothetical protein